MSERAAVVLAGGKGSRLGPGPPKALRSLAGSTLLARALSQVRGWAEEVWVSAPPGLELVEVDAPIVRDHAAFGPWAGPLVALASALEAVSAPWALVLAVDLPFARREHFDLLWSRRLDPTTPVPGTPIGAAPLGVVPWTARGPEPLLALYRREIAPMLLAATYSGERAAHRPVSALPLVRVSEEELRRVDPSLESLMNLNTLDDWARAEAKLAR